MLKSILLLALAALSSASPLVSTGQSVFSTGTNGTDAKVNVTLYVMSRCPDAVCSLYLDWEVLMAATVRECL
jgi:hypothetical protein